MSTMTTTLAAGCLALASFCASAQTGAPPTHPATGGTDAAASPTTPPTHPATGTSGATPDAAAAAGKQNPSVNGYKESQPSADDTKRSNARTTSKPAPGDGARNPTSTDSMAQDKKPRHPAAPKQ
ncbi:hypothetical protein [Variovorax sp. OV329]|uniref:hypothetical protein n=1 Tax=Variovorax sp. OV329 TaxID=1882825 RepID=UPI0008EB3BD8|nr:hypothetical protein [Variovorax sp. OV329]SFL95884.1 hypothetical protein SAMN05444747_101461 [Variovorax sp. OV329]